MLNWFDFFKDKYFFLRNNFFLIFVVFIILLNGCSSTSTSVAKNVPDDTDSTTTEITGIVIDPYIVGATVCCDLNSNDTCDSDEPSSITASDGTYTLSSDCSDDLNIIAVGGIDSVTEVENSIQKSLYSSEYSNYININPITTILSDVDESERDTIMSALVGDSFSVNEIYQSDFYSECSSDSGSSSCTILETSLQISNLKSVAISTFRSTDSSIATSDVM